MPTAFVVRERVPSFRFHLLDAPTSLDARWAPEAPITRHLSQPVKPGLLRRPMRPAKPSAPRRRRSARAPLAQVTVLLPSALVSRIAGGCRTPDGAPSNRLLLTLDR